MKTTLEVPDELYRAAKAKAALEGVRLTDLVTDGLRIVVHGSARVGQKVTFPLIPASPERPKLTSTKVTTALAQMQDDEDAQAARLRR